MPANNGKPVLIDTLGIPIVLAPLAGGPSTPELAAAVSGAGGLGFLAAGYLSADALGERVERTRALTVRPFGVNLFVPGPAAPPQIYTGYVQRLEAEGLQLGTPKFDDDGWDAKLALLERSPVAVVSFTFGLPDRDVLERVRATGAEAWVTVTSPEEAEAAKHADALVVQGSEAGGHRGSWVDHEALTPVSLHALLQLIDADVPLIASGGIATASAVRADAGVVEEDVDAAEVRVGLLDRLGHGLVVANVGDERQALGRDFVAQALELRGRAHPVARVLQRLADVERDDVIAVLGQRERGGAALAVGGAGDQGHHAA
jgi:nitronate monooxygenase